MDPSSILAGATAVLATTVVNALFGMISESRKAKSDKDRQIRDLATKLALEQWKLDSARWESDRVELESSGAPYAKHIPNAQITATYKRIADTLKQE